jgi:Ca-activated chloride channel family protein
MSRGLVAAALAVLALGPTAIGQAPLRLVIVSPSEGVYVSDRVTLEARIEPSERRGDVADVTFFADGRQVCRSADVEAPKCSWDAGARIQAHTIRVVATTTAGDRIVATVRTRAVDVKESVSVGVVQINASVSDRGGAFVRGLTREQFRVTEDGVAQTIGYFAAEEAPLEIVVAMDISASMGAALGDLRTAVREFLQQLRPEDQVTLVAFNEEPFVLTQRETDPALRIQALDRLATFGGTRLYDAIIHALQLLSRRPGRRSLIMFSDGEDQSSQATFAQVDHALKGSDAVMFMVGLGRGREQANLRETMEALAEPSGGRALFAERPADLRRMFVELRSELAHQYLVGYESSNPARDGAWRQLTVEIPGTNYRVRARRGYFASTP